MMVVVFVPALAAEASDEMRTAASAHSFVLLEVLTHFDHHLAHALQSLDRFAEFCDGELKRYRKIVSNGYSGTVAIPPSVRSMLLTRF
jgi:hypothetical protein